ncbi:MAG: hypothetical protein H6631_16460 [Anaerolineaceae bacterium]|nr:hypothetical protein [Anaerolineaceae bacterium]
MLRPQRLEPEEIIEETPPIEGILPEPPVNPTPPGNRSPVGSAAGSRSDAAPIDPD